MGNLLLRRLLFVPVVITATLIGFYGYVYLNFPFNVAVIAASVGVIVAYLVFVKQKEKSERLNVFYKATNEFGNPISFDNHSASFERNGTRFECEFPQGKYDTAFKVNFYIPNVYQRFIIQHNAIFKKSLPGCEFIENSPLSGLIFLHSENREFLLNLLKKREITNEIYNYPEKIASVFSIVFDNGIFEIQWTPPLDQQITGLHQICQTAVVFHDELRKYATTKRK